jgi:hypothetical protein
MINVQVMQSNRRLHGNTIHLEEEREDLGTRAGASGESHSRLLSGYRE